MCRLKKILLAVITIILLGFILITWQVNTITNELVNLRVERTSLEDIEQEVGRVEVESEDGLKLSAWNLEVANPKGIVIMLHGMHGMDAGSLLGQAKILQDNGYEVFSLDLRAHGQSGGEEIGLGYSEVKDVNALLDWIAESGQYRGQSITLYGYSMGGATAINTAAQRDDVDKVVSISAFESFEANFVHFLREEGLPEFVANLYRPAIRLVLLNKYRINPVSNSPLKQIDKIGPREILLVHGMDDGQVPFMQAENLKQRAGSNTRLLSVKGQGHEIGFFLLDDPVYRKQILSFISLSPG